MNLPDGGHDDRHRALETDGTAARGRLRQAGPGIGAFRIAFDRPRATIGPQPENIEGAQVWVLPNPSGLNAHYQLAALSAEFGRLKAAVSAARRRHVRRPGTDPRACGAAAAAPAGSRSPR